jgi:hypothetical protein
MPGPALNAPLVDPLHEKEMFASEVADVGFVHGNVIILLANLRFDEPLGNEAPKAHRFVVGRIVLTHLAANQLMLRLQNLAMQLEVAGKPPASQKPS